MCCASTTRIAMSAHSRLRPGQRSFTGTALPLMPFILTNGRPTRAGDGFWGAGQLLLHPTLTGPGVFCRCASPINMFSFFGRNRDSSRAVRTFRKTISGEQSCPGANQPLHELTAIKPNRNDIAAKPTAHFTPPDWRSFNDAPGCWPDIRQDICRHPPPEPIASSPDLRAPGCGSAARTSL